MNQIIFPALLILSLVLLPPPATAAELSGVVYSKGAPVANLTVIVKETNMKKKTDSNGAYRFDLAPGGYTLVVRGQEFPVKVGSDKSNLDIQLQ